MFKPGTVTENHPLGLKRRQAAGRIPGIFPFQLNDQPQITGAFS